MKRSVSSTDQFRFIPSLTYSQLTEKAPASYKLKLWLMKKINVTPSKSYIIICYEK